MSFGSVIKGINKVQQALEMGNPITDPTASFKSDGFILPATFNSDGNGLPYTKVPSNRNGRIKRNIIHWLIPEFGLVRMYNNPGAISYNYKKHITKQRTKNGFTLQYWGEELPTLNISGNTGSSGYEGINLLYEIYRAEQFAFDSEALLIAANNSANDLATKGLNAIGGAIGGATGAALFGSGGEGSGLVGGLLGLDSGNSISSSNEIPSLAQLAFTVEMYYNGMAFRGFFENMTVNERADNFLLDYQIAFTVTQIRGYRVNNFPWQKSAKDGPSRYDTPLSYSGIASLG